MPATSVYSRQMDCSGEYVTGVIVGIACTAFSYALKYVIDFRSTHPWILFGLPFAGL